ncbi:MAG: hypothetical protein KDH96_07530 [Candidatus Riesia sp.]|nr:hypothetical protein [Candidatus Riesia sp.]
MNNIIIIIAASLILTFTVEYLIDTQEQQEQQKIDYNYKIDLKQDYYIIYDNHGKVDTVAHGELEEFIINDNM